jgi:SAM-dependent methyltransferase
VGSGWGFLLDELSNRYTSVVGIEPSQQLSYYSQNILGIHTYVSSLSQYLKIYPHRQFDIVTSLHVIEHVINPKQYVKDLMKLLKPGGLLYLETPNADSHLLHAEKENYTFLIPPDHIWLFSKKSFTYLLPSNSRYHAVSTYSYPEHFMGIVKAVLRRKKTNINTDVSNIRIFELFTWLLNLNHKGSILELYINKKN